MPEGPQRGTPRAFRLWPHDSVRFLLPAISLHTFNLLCVTLPEGMFGYEEQIAQKELLFFCVLPDIGTLKEKRSELHLLLADSKQ